MFNNFFAKAMLARQLKNVPEEEKNKMIEVVMSNPDLFKKVADSAKEKIQKGMPQMEATMAAVRENQEELQKLFGNKK